MMVTLSPGKYIVSLNGEQATVSKSGLCSCGGRNGGSPCPHILAVRQHIRVGGKRAPPEIEDLPQTPDVCPICGGPIETMHYRCRSGIWSCDDPTHFWVWKSRSLNRSVKEFLIEPHENKPGPFYKMTTDERQDFRALAETGDVLRWREAKAATSP